MNAILRNTIWALGSLSLQAVALGQTGTWVLDGWPHEKNGYYAGRTEIYADGIRMKITEWRGDSEDESDSMEIYFLGQTVIQVFTWNDDRIGLVFQTDEPLPHAEVTSDGQAILPPPFPPLVTQETDMPCGEGCMYRIRNIGFQALEPREFAPGGALHGTFSPPSHVELISKDEFFQRFSIAPMEWTRFQ
jgi:hypothetical protein